MSARKSGELCCDCKIISLLLGFTIVTIWLIIAGQHPCTTKIFKWEYCTEMSISANNILTLQYKMHHLSDQKQRGKGQILGVGLCSSEGARLEIHT